MNFPLLPFGVPNAPTVVRVGGTHRPKFGVVVDLSSVLGKFVSDKAPLFKNTAVQRRLGSNFGPKFGTFWPL